MLWYCDSFSVLKQCLFQTGKAYILIFITQQYVLPYYSCPGDPKLCALKSTIEFPTLIILLPCFDVRFGMPNAEYPVCVSLRPDYARIYPLLSACLELRAHPKFIFLYSMWNLSYKIIVSKFFNFLLPLKGPLQSYFAPLHSSREVYWLLAYLCI